MAKMMDEFDEPAGELFIAFEGGSVRTAERNGQYLLIINQTAMLDMLDADDREGIDAMREVAFSTLAARDAYIRERGWGLGV
jgi:hypothetical protein